MPSETKPTSPIAIPHPPMLKHTKIVATIGPASASFEMIHRLADAGANVFRLNFSHGNHESHLAVIRAIRQVCAEHSLPLGILGDLSGPKLRITDVAGDGVRVAPGDIVEFSSLGGDGTGNRFGVNFPGLHEAATLGERILLDDGNIVLTVVDVTGDSVRCRAENNGVITSRKGVNLPDTRLPVPALTDKDRDDLKFALENDVDMVALSFVRTAADLKQAYDAMDAFGRRVPLLAKVEKAEAVGNLVEIVEACQGAMVARGDLGSEMPIEQVPAIQKRLIRLCNERRKTVITATQMLDSMIRNPRPTRAEATDVYNAIMDGTDAVMLSGETAAGAYPVEAVETMARIALQAESELPSCKGLDWEHDTEQVAPVADVMAHAAVSVAVRVHADLIICPTWSGATACRVAKYRPLVPVFACSTRTTTVNPLCLVWGVHSRIMHGELSEEVRASEADAILNASLRCAREHGFGLPGTRVVFIAGLPLGISDTTNFLRVIDIP